MTANVSARTIQFAILEILAVPPSGHYPFVKRHTTALLGSDGHPGEIEHRLSVTFDPDERARANLALLELRDSGLIHPDFGQPGGHDNWFIISDAGRWAIANRALDQLDQALEKINPHLLECRDGAHTALALNNVDASRQAATSLRTLLENLNPNPTKGNPYYALIDQYKPGVSKKRRDLLNRDAETLQSEYVRLCKLHELGTFDHGEVAGSLRIVEAILERVLL